MFIRTPGEAHSAGHRNLPIWLVLLGTVLLIPSPLLADEAKWGLCSTLATESFDIADEELEDQPIEIDADRARRNAEGTAFLAGNILLRRGTQTLKADEAEYFDLERRAEAHGNVVFNDRGLTIEGTDASLNTETEQVTIENADYLYTPLHARGEASQIHRPSANVADLEDATYTTCDPGDTDWLFSASKLHLNRETGQGTARNALVRFKNVPILYTPWLRFPIDDRRQTGFLVPVFGNTSDSGLQFELPFYWNIAPHKDATFTPRILQDRGLQLKSEFRYLYDTGGGDLNLEALDDDQADDERWLVGFNNQTQISRRLRSNILFTRVSDDNYFEDLGDSLNVSSTRFLEARADLQYSLPNWNLLGRAQGFQSVDETVPGRAEPFKRLPQFILNGNYNDLPLGLDFRLRGEFVRFDHDQRIDGERYDLWTEVERPILGAGYFIRPAARIRHTRYSLDNTLLGTDRTPTRSQPTFSLDSGLIFEREFDRGGKYLQTLEPRLYYLYVPERDQDDFPLFDTGRLEFSFAQLFRNDRFSNADRVGDANQVSLALTSRILSRNNGEELLSASAGQIFYFRDREVALIGDGPGDTNLSNTAAELSLRLNDRWSASGALLWDPEDANTERFSTRLGYAGDNNKVFNVSYRYRRNGLDGVEGIDQTDVALAWPLTDRWRFVGRWNHDLRANRELELLGGIEYASCCWKIRLVARRFVNDIEADYNNTIQLQLVLKGLTNVGSPIGELLEDSILGYRDVSY